jgi:PIN domain nuclease of toxin-antitoxin system
MIFLDTHAVVWLYQKERIGLETDGISFLPAAERAGSLKWARDPFDRLIVAQADFHGADLLTRDEKIRENYARAFW